MPDMRNATLKSQLVILGTQQKGSLDIRAAYQSEGILYEDTSFPSAETSLFYRHRPVTGHIRWKRPYELSKKPSFHSVEKSQFREGIIDESWIFSAYTCLCLTPGVLEKCVPKHQDFGTNYVGMFMFRFWRFGEWVDVIIDDKLPTHEGALIYLRGEDEDDFMPALLEKAYAKFYGSYESIYGGFLGWSLLDLTGGLSMSYEIQGNIHVITDLLALSIRKASLMGAWISVSRTNGKRQKLPRGLLSGTPYAVVGIAKFDHRGSQITLVRLKTCGTVIDWTGPWSRRSPIWESVDDVVIKKLGILATPLTEFWMSLSDFSELFTHFSLCHLTSEMWSLDLNLQHRSKWHVAIAHRHWRKGYNAGGGPTSNFAHMNPQFYLELKQTTHIVMSLLQNSKRKIIPCVCGIYEAPAGRQQRLPQSFFMQSQPLTNTAMASCRDVVKSYNLASGTYVIVPMTEKKNQDAKFILRVFAATDIFIRELDEEDQWLTQLANDIHMRHPLTEMANRHYQQKFFIRADEDGEVDSRGLHIILATKKRSNSFSNCLSAEMSGAEDTPLSADTCRAAVGFVDRNLNGKVNYNEFCQLLMHLQYWKELFRINVTKGDGYLDTYNLRTALTKAGFSVSNKTLEAITVRLSCDGMMSYDGFVNTLIRLHAAHRRFQMITEEAKLVMPELTRILKEIIQMTVYS